MRSKLNMQRDEAFQFLLTEILGPFRESSLWDDYAKEYEERTGRNFEDDYDWAVSELVLYAQ